MHFNGHYQQLLSFADNCPKIPINFFKECAKNALNFDA